MSENAFQFEDFELQMDSFELYHQGEAVDLEPQELSVLACLVRHADTLVTKEALLEEVWGHQHVTDSAIATRIKGVRRALNDDGRQQRLVKTIHGRGFRFVGEVASSESGMPAAPAPQTLQTILPRERTPMFGRDDLKERTIVALGSNRMVSLLGIGGAGKTRLSVAVARSVVSDFEDGVGFVDLIPVRDEEQLVNGVGQALGLREAVDLESLITALQRRRVLIVLDNCEHLIREVQNVADAILDQTESVHLLATSRVPLELLDEFRIPVGTLRTAAKGDEEAPALAMLRASASRIGVTIPPEEQSKALDLCARLDGLPLALDLAAAQLRHLTVDDLRERLEQRFTLLSQSPTNTARSNLEGVLQETFSKLTGPQVDLLAQLAVFPATFDFAAAETVGGDDATWNSGDFASLTDQALIMRTEHDNRRWRLLDSVRLFVAQQSSPEVIEANKRRHAHWVLGAHTPHANEGFWNFSMARWYGSHLEDVRVAEGYFFDQEMYEEGAEILIRQALAMVQGLGTQAAMTLARVELYIPLLTDPTLVSRLHCAVVYCARSAHKPELMLEHGDLAVIASDQGDDEYQKFFARYMAVWPRLAGKSALSRIEELESFLPLPDYEDLPDAIKLFRGYVYCLTGRVSEVSELLQPSVDRLVRLMDTNHEPTYTLASVMFLWGMTTLMEDSAAVVKVFDQAIRDKALWEETEGNLVHALAYAANNQAQKTANLCQTIRAKQVNARSDYSTVVLLPCALAAHRAGEVEEARRWCAAALPVSMTSYLVPLAANTIAQTLEVTDPAALTRPEKQALADDALAWLERVST